jgi:hypothetical protein
MKVEVKMKEGEKKEIRTPCLYSICMMCDAIYGIAKESDKGAFSHGLCSDKCIEDYKREYL